MSDKTKTNSSLFSKPNLEGYAISADSPPTDQVDDQGRFQCGDLNIRIDREGTWFYNGTPIGRMELVRLFSSVLHKDHDDRYWLVTPAEKGKIIVEDAPFMAVELSVTGHGEKQSLNFRTNIDEIVQASLTHPLRFLVNPETGEPSPYILVRENLEAKLTRSVFYQLVDLGVEQWVLNKTKFGVWSNEKFFEIGQLNQ